MLTIRTRQPISSAEDFDNVSAIWMMACNDEDAIITYAGIAYRLRWPRQDVARVRNLVRNWAELFSTLIASSWFRERQQWVINGKHYPAWAQDPDFCIGTKSAEDEIRGLTRDDVFRCQLRTQTSHDRCTPDQIKIGLEHLDRLRRAAADMRDEWLRRLSTFVVPIAALATTVCISLATSWISLQTLYNSREVAQAEASLKAWDLGAKIRGEAYEQALEAMQRAYAAAQRGEAGASAMNSELERMRLDYYRIEPLISASSKRDMIRAQRRKLEDFLMKIAAGPQPADRASVADSFEKLHEEMHHCLYNALFALTPEEQRDPILRRYGAEPEACEPTGLPN